MKSNRGPGVTRREVLRAAAAAPWVAPLGRVPLRWLPGGDDRAVVVVELAGGNDGLNTLLPVEDPRWARARPGLSGVRRGAHALGASGFALHPALGPVAGLFERGQCAFVHGVGYEPPDRSHFRSRDIWHTADPALRAVAADTTGWLGRAADVLAAQGAAVPGMSVGSLRVPLCLKARGVVVPSLSRLEDYELLVDPAGGLSEARRAEIARLARAAGSGDGDDPLAFVSDVARASLDGEAKLRDALRRYRPRVEFGDDDLSRALQLVARVVVTGFGTQLFHVETGGFDTHANQAPTHDALLRQLGRALDAFVRELDAHGALDRTVVLVHSEFGRRVAENESHGTDHGAAAPVALLGAAVRPGLHGTAPDLEDLDDGDVRTTCDFRRVYAEVLGFLGVEPPAVLGEAFDPIGVLERT